MDVSYNWLREIFPTTFSPEDLAVRLTGVGLAVEGIHTIGDDRVFDIDLTSNRPDCLSHLGVAREVAAIERGSFELLDQRNAIAADQLSGETAEFAGVEIEAADLCPRYAARVVRGVKIGPSPEWLVERLLAVGQRSINNVADITNLVMLEMGQPLHAFDLDKLKEHRIVVRRARTGEKLTTLDGVERALDPDMLMICDAERPVAVGGVMGGAETEISNATTNVLIESAYFLPASVRRTSRALGLTTEASYRFERGADWAGVRRAQDRCVALICQLAGGTATADAIDVFSHEPGTVNVSLRPERVAALTGLNVEVDEITRILTSLGFGLQRELVNDGTGRMNWAVPSWRVDVGIEEDLVEEVARHTGYDRMRDQLPPSRGAGELQPAEAQKRALRASLAVTGFDEAISYSFINTAHDGKYQLIPEFREAAEFVSLRDSIIEGATRMRPTLLAGLLEGVRHNFNHGTRDVRLFEMGRIFTANAVSGELPVEREAFALVMTGGVVEEGRAGVLRAVDFYDLKGALESAVQALRIPELRFAAADVLHLRPGQSAAITTLDGTAVGTIGTLAESLNLEFKFRQPVFVAELDLTTLLSLQTIPARYSPLARFPAVVRDISLLTPRPVTVAQLIARAEETPAAEFRGAQLVDVYEGQGVPGDRRSVTLRFEYRADDRTLRDEEVEALHSTLVQRLSADFDAQLRS